MSHSHSHYVHGTDRDEQRRLSTLNDILNGGSLRELGLRGGSGPEKGLLYITGRVADI